LLTAVLYSIILILQLELMILGTLHYYIMVSNS